MKMTKILALALIAALLLCGCMFMKENNSTVQLVYVYGDLEIRELLTLGEATTFVNMISEKPLIADEPSCNFSEEVVISFEGTNFAPALDGCGMVKVLEMEKYFQLTEDEMQSLTAIFEAHGATFPCE